jgi:predicted permease
MSFFTKAALRFERRLMGARARLRAWIHRGANEREIADEIQHHIAEQADRHLESGLPADAARRRALRDFGGVEGAKEHCRDVRRVPIVETVLRDVRYAIRALRRQPAFTTVAVLTLALGIGANTAVFSLVNAILLRPLPYPDPDRLVAMTGTYPRGAFAAMRDRIHSMRVAVYAQDHRFNLTGRDRPARVRGAMVSAEMFDILGIPAASGRTFRSGEDAAGADSFVVLSHAAWQRRFGGDPAIVGRSITLDGVNREVIGIMPPAFAFPNADIELWIPLHIDARDPQAHWASDYMPGIGRLHRGATIEQAAADLRAFQADLLPLFPWPMPPAWNADATVVPLHTGLTANVRGRLLVLLGVVGMILVIACANVANLTLARAGARAKEIGVRAALGAGQLRIAQQLLTESVVLAGAGGAAGLLVATQGLSLLARVLPANTPGLDRAAVDWRVLAFTACLAIATGIVFGVAPAWQAARTNVSDSLTAGGRGAAHAVSPRLRNALVVAEVASAVLVVIAAGLLVRSFWTLSRVDTGFRPARLVTAHLTPSRPFCADADRCLAFYAQVLQNVHSTPGVSRAALINTLPLAGDVAKRSVIVEGLRDAGAKRSLPLFWLNVVTPEYFRVMNVRLYAGREFTAADLSGNPAVAIVPRSTARKYWNDETAALGKRIRFVNEDVWHTVVGVADDVRAFDLQRDVPPWIDGSMYVPFSRRATLENGALPVEMTLVASSAAGDADGSVGAMIKDAVAAASADVPVSEPRRLAAAVTDAVSIPASIAMLFSTFAALALALGMVGIYGVLAFLVSKRTREIGIRLALGARRRDVLWAVAKDGLMLSLTGVALGMTGAVVVMRLLARELYGVSPTDPATYAAVAAIMILVTLAACAAPTHRAARIDPVKAVNGEW